MSRRHSLYFDVYLFAILGLARVLWNVENLKFSYMGFCRRGKNVEADARSRHLRESVYFFVADRVAFGKALPILSIPCLDAVALDVLAVIEPFHNHAAIEGDWPHEIRL